MAATANLTSLDPILKTLYPQKEIARICYENAPLLAMVPKSTDFGGANLVLALRYAMTQGRSAAISNAITNKTASANTKFVVTRSKDYSIFSIDGETIRAAKGDKNAIVEGIALEVDAAMDAIKRSLQISLFRNGGGAIGKGDGAYSVAGNVITLSNANDIVNFEVGQILNLASTDGTSGATRSGTLTVTNVDRDAGTVQTSANVNVGITSPVNTDYIFQDGDFGAKLKGLDAWVPSSAPTSTAFFGVDRSVDKTRLGGIRVTGTGLPVEEALQKGLARVWREGGKTSHVFLNNDDFLNLVLSLGTRLMYTDVKTDVGVGFSGVRVVGPMGEVKVFADPNCQSGVAWLLQMDTWKLRSLGECPGFLSDDGLRMLRGATADSYDGRIGYYAQLTCEAPGYNARVAL